MPGTPATAKEVVNAQLHDSIYPHTLWDGRYFGPMIPATPAQWRAAVEGQLTPYGPNGWALGDDGPTIKAIIDEAVDLYTAQYYKWVFGGTINADGSIPDWQAEARKTLAPAQVQVP